MDSKQMHRVGKFLAYVLRHRPDEVGLTLDEEGWVDAEQLIQAINDKRGWALTMGDLQRVVDADNKGRYSLRDGLVRANQGHSVEGVMAVDATPREPPLYLYHGTTEERWAKIQKSGGLKKMKRHHVHLSDQLKTAKSVGSRHRKEKLLVLEIAARAMHGDGHIFLKSENGVWLTDEVPLQYLVEKAGI